MTFQTTRWSLVLRARQHDAAGQCALGELLAAYWQPVWVLYRRLGAGAADAADLTQGLFAHLLARGDLATATPERGRFRAFLATCARHWWANEHERAAATKRGGDVQHVPFDHDDAEAWLGAQPVDRDDAAALFDRRWAWTVLDRALAELARLELAAGRGAQFDVLRERLDDRAAAEPWAVLAARLDTTEGALRVAAHRLRARLRDCVLAEVRDTLPPGGEPGDELQQLLQALQQPRPAAVRARSSDSG